MTVYSYNANQLQKKMAPKKPFWSGNKIAIATSSLLILSFGALVANAPSQPAPVVVASSAPVVVTPSTPVVVSGYDSKTDECRAKDGSGVFINYTKGFGLDEWTCEKLHSTYNVNEFAKEQGRFSDKALVAPGKYDLAIMGAERGKQRDKEAAESQTRLEEWAVRSYEANQKHETKCQDLIESRGYGEVGCY